MLQLLGRFTNSFGQGWGEGAKKGTKSPHRASPDNRRRRFKGLMDIGMACQSQPDQFLLRLRTRFQPAARPCAFRCGAFLLVTTQHESTTTIPFRSALPALRAVRYPRTHVPTHETSRRGKWFPFQRGIRQPWLSAHILDAISR